MTVSMLIVGTIVIVLIVALVYVAMKDNWLG